MQTTIMKGVGLDEKHNEKQMTDFGLNMFGENNKLLIIKSFCKLKI